MFVGSTNHLISFDVSESLQVNSVFAHCPDEATRTKCLTENDASQCYNFIRFLQPVPAEAHSNDTQFTGKIIACGTNAVSPKCTVHSRGNLSEWFYLTNQEDVGFSSYLSNRPMVGLLGTNAAFYGATVFTPYESRISLGIAPGALNGSSRFSAQTPEGDQYWLSNPSINIISMYEMDHHIYIFGRELAQNPELPIGISTIYSRVVRICKNDHIELPVQSTEKFITTFQKARMRCSSVRNIPNYPYDYNEIQSTYLVSRSSGESVLYATFSSSPNGPKGTAVCKFEFDPAVETSLAGVFETVKYFAPENGVPNSDVWVEMEGAPFVCPGQPGGHERDPAEVEQYKLLMNGEAAPTDGHSIYTADGVIITQIAAETFTYDGQEYQIMFMGTDSGEIWQVVIIDNRETFEFRRASLQSGNDITYIQLTMPDSATKIRKLYYANTDFLSEMTLGDCSKYTSCHECMESNDPYCAWQDGSTCVNILLQPFPGQATEALRGFTRIGEVCNPVLPTHTTPSGSASATKSEIPSIRPSYAVFTDIPRASIDSDIKSTCPPVSTRPPANTHPSVSTNPVTGGLEPSPQNIPIAVVVGATLGGLIIGIIIGMVAGCLGLATKRALVDTKSFSPTRVENGANHYNCTRNGTGANSVEPTKCNGVSSPTSSGSSQGLDIAIEELEDDAITDLPSNTTSSASSHQKKKRIPKGRTPSTRWLRASESEGNSP